MEEEGEQDAGRDNGSREQSGPRNKQGGKSVVGALESALESENVSGRLRSVSVVLWCMA